jgi:micrococcal nuclease
MFEYNCTIQRVVDGDTVIVDLDLGFDVHKIEHVRLARINSPELKTEEGKLAKSFVKGFTGREAVIRTSKTDKYGRYIGEIILTGDIVVIEGSTKSPNTFNLSDIIVGNGFAAYVDYK